MTIILLWLFYIIYLQVHFQRELKVWGDTVKLCYGDSHSDNQIDNQIDNQFLWNHMIKYTEINAWLVVNKLS